jgi:hypothetical protein
VGKFVYAGHNRWPGKWSRPNGDLAVRLAASASRGRPRHAPPVGVLCYEALSKVHSVPFLSSLLGLLRSPPPRLVFLVLGDGFVSFGLPAGFVI